MNNMTANFIGLHGEHLELIIERDDYSGHNHLVVRRQGNPEVLYYFHLLLNGITVYNGGVNGERSPWASVRGEGTDMIAVAK